MILDGWGEGRHDYSNAIWTQGTPNIDALRAKYPCGHLQACGEYVGLPDGQMGNSEVGHMNLGAASASNLIHAKGSVSLMLQLGICEP